VITTHETDITTFGWLELTHLSWATRPGTRFHIRSLRLMLPYGLHKHEDFGAHYVRLGLLKACIESRHATLRSLVALGCHIVHGLLIAGCVHT